MKKYFVFTERSINGGKFYCGDVYHNEENDGVRHGSCYLTFSECVELGFCRAFETEKEAEQCVKSQEAAMERVSEYALNAMSNAERYGVEGVDVDF